MRPHPDRLTRLPEQYFGALLARVVAAAAVQGEALVDLGRGNPETGPPQHVIDALAEAANRPTAHGYAPFRGMPELRAAVAARYRSAYGVELDPDAEVAVVPGTKTAIVELSLVLAERGDTVVLPDPYYPDYPSGPALAGARLATVPLDRAAGWAPDFPRAPRDNVAALYLNYPSNPCAVTVPDGVFEEAIRFGHETGAAIVHDFAYADLAFDGYRPPSIFDAEGAREVAVELYSLTKGFSLAGWRVAFVLGRSDVVGALARLKSYLDYGSFQPLQIAATVALREARERPAEVAEIYQGRRNALCDGLARIGWDVPRPPATMFVWARIPTAEASQAFALRLLRQGHVAVSPGSGFGADGEGFVRFALVENEQRIGQAVRGIRRVLT